jgi:cystathionine beta-lyase/cystathionine gamma-synthase
VGSEVGRCATAAIGPECARAFDLSKSTTHSGFIERELAEVGITDGLVRVFVGIEHWRDLFADLERPLEKV